MENKVSDMTTMIHQIISFPGSFLIPYITFMILGALPMFLLEYSLGQFSSNGPISVWKICPLMKGETFFVIYGLILVVFL